MIRRLALAIAFSLTAVAPSGAAEDADFASTVARTVDNYIVPAYEALHQQSSVLVAAVERFCQTPSPENRAGLEDAFAATIKSWAAVDFLRFGPMAQDGRYERFAFWPDVHGTGARQLRQFLAREDERLLQAETLAEQSAAVQGLPALESLLYGGSKALIEAPGPEPYRCALAVAVAQNMETIAAETVEGWRGAPSWTRLLTEPGAENPVYRSHSEAMTEVLRGILTGLEQMRDQRILPAIGDSIDTARASRAPNNMSGQALPYLRASAAALEDYVEASGILELLPETGRYLARSIGFEFANLNAALSAAGADLEAALRSPERRDKLNYATIVLASLRDLMQNRLSPAAGLTPGFNSLDGD